MNYSDQNTLLMSESLKGMIPELESSEDDLSELESNYIIAILHFDQKKYLIGNLVSASFEDAKKLDIKANLQEVFSLLKSLLFDASFKCNSIELHLGEEIIDLKKSYKVTNLKIMELDHQNKSCILAIDLVDC